MIIAISCLSLVPLNLHAQGLSITAGLGFEYFDAPSLSQYLNYAAPGSITPGTYTTAGQFVGACEYPISGDWSLGVELGYITKSSSSSGQAGQLQIDYSCLMPSITLRKIVTGENFYVKFGGGIGYHFGYLGATNIYSNAPTNYSARGIGLKFDALIDTKLGDNLYARVDGEARSEFIGNLKASDGSDLTFLDATSNPQPVNMHLSGIGLTFGLVYYF